MAYGDGSGEVNIVSRVDPGRCVVVILREPREKCWGVLDEINSAGVYLRGLDLGAFDDWVHAVKHDEPFIAPASLFFPLWRVERIELDERMGELPSLAEQFEQRTNRSVYDFY